MCSDDFDHSEQIACGFRRARKEHPCFACSETIRAGDRYHILCEKRDEFEQYKHCLRCWAMFCAILDGGAEAVQYDLHCGVSWQEEMGDEPPPAVAALAFMTPDEAQALRPGDPLSEFGR